jgi:hypothetical protein
MKRSAMQGLSWPVLRHVQYGYRCGLGGQPGYGRNVVTYGVLAWFMQPTAYHNFPWRAPR